MGSNDAAYGALIPYVSFAIYFSFILSLSFPFDDKNENENNTIFPETKGKYRT